MNEKIIKAISLLNEAKNLINEVEKDAIQFGITSDKILNTNIESFGLKTRTVNCLRTAGIKLVGELIQHSELDLLRYRDFGNQCVQDVNDKLAILGLKLGTYRSSSKKN